MSKEPIEYLKHIRDESLYIISVIHTDLTKDDFLRDELFKKSCRKKPRNNWRSYKEDSC
jgi:hypothetical protein